MLASNIPASFTLTWAQNAGGAFIRVIPSASQIGVQNGAASLNDGFPPLNFQPVGSGGVPPFGQDMNGILNQISAWAQWDKAGGPVGYDATFSTAVGGYPAGAIISASILGNFWFNTVDNNVTNPDTGGAGWLGFNPTSQLTRIVTASGVFVTNASDGAIGLNRSAALATSTTTLPVPSVGKTYAYEDLAGNFNAFPLTIIAPGGHLISGLSSVVLNVNHQVSNFRYYGSNVWSCSGIAT
jgi:hypothetical protein